jgi:hypothetical protein
LKLWRIATGALVVTTIGASRLDIGVLFVGASMAVGYSTGELATKARDSIADIGAASMEKEGIIATCSCNEFINGRPSALATGSMVECAKDAGSQQMAEAFIRKFIYRLPDVHKWQV